MFQTDNKQRWYFYYQEYHIKQISIQNSQKSIAHTETADRDEEKMRGIAMRELKGEVGKSDWKCGDKTQTDIWSEAAVDQQKAVDPKIRSRSWPSQNH